MKVARRAGNPGVLAKRRRTNIPKTMCNSLGDGLFHGVIQQKRVEMIFYDGHYRVINFIRISYSKKFQGSHQR